MYRSCDFLFYDGLFPLNACCKNGFGNGAQVFVNQGYALFFPVVNGCGMVSQVAVTVVVEVSGDEGGAEVVCGHWSPSYPVDADNVLRMDAAEIGRSSGSLLFDWTGFLCCSKWMGGWWFIGPGWWMRSEEWGVV